MATSKKSPKKSKATVRVRRKAIKHQSFKVSQEQVPFLTFRFTEQTFYWIILLSMILALALWVYNIQLKTTDILNSISMIKP